jgi:hypothetical protein
MRCRRRCCRQIAPADLGTTYRTEFNVTIVSQNSGCNFESNYNKVGDDILGLASASSPVDAFGNSLLGSKRASRWSCIPSGSPVRVPREHAFASLASDILRISK